MLISKVEEPELMNRQLRYFTATNGLKCEVNGDGSYHYEYIPGQMCTDVHEVFLHLSRKIWNRPPLGVCDADHYPSYIKQLCLQFNIVLPHQIELAILETFHSMSPVVLCHGDATMENFIQTDHGIVDIDPGLPRGFNCQENDIGKMLQSILTCWERVRHDVVVEWRNIDQLVVTRSSIVALLTHWIRIVKNKHRHPEYIETYARNVVIPKLVEELTHNSDTTWHRQQLAQLQNFFKRESIGAK